MNKKGLNISCEVKRKLYCMWSKVSLEMKTVHYSNSMTIVLYYFKQLFIIKKKLLLLVNFQFCEQSINNTIVSKIRDIRFVLKCYPDTLIFLVCIWNSYFQKSILFKELFLKKLINNIHCLFELCFFSIWRSPCSSPVTILLTSRSYQMMSSFMQ